MPAKLDPLNAIALLGFIEEEPRSGYELKRAIDDRLENILEITAGTVYYTLKRLEHRGWIRGTVSRSGKRPERRTYRITPRGKEAFAHLLEEAAFQEDRMLSPFDVVLYFTPRLPPDLLRSALDRRLAHLDHFRSGLHQLEGRFPQRWPFHLYYLREKAKDVADANERWWQRFRRKILEKSTVKG
jgi:DNA-binding PadR family transcriptional regulator